MPSQHPEASQGPALLDEPGRSPPAPLQGAEQDVSAWGGHGQDAGPQPPALEPPVPAWPGQDTGATQEPQSVPSSSLGSIYSRESDVGSTRLGRGSATSQASSGYAGDQEDSEVSLVGSSLVVRPNSRPGAQDTGGGK